MSPLQKGSKINWIIKVVIVIYNYMINKELDTILSSFTYVS
jgi:hypothetical protein